VAAPSEKDLVAARARARRAWARAAESSKRAARFETLAEKAPEGLRPLYQSLAESSHRAARMHGASARLQASWAGHIETSLRRVSATVSTPQFMAAVADVVGAGSTSVVIWSREHEVAAAMATDLQARAAVDIELVVGEGPAHDTASIGAPFVVRETDIAEQWPAFARATAAMSMHVVAAAPLQSGGMTIGAITVFDPPWATAEDHLPDLTGMAGAVVESLSEELTASAEREAGAAVEQPPDVPCQESLLLADDWTAVVHQAAGMVARHTGRDTATALALIRARAFADDVACTDLANRIVAGEVRLDD
jgi:transcriptional regulator with GAF, ATPase, and Fis domain